jgi:hypothetical protein
MSSGNVAEWTSAVSTAVAAIAAIAGASVAWTEYRRAKRAEIEERRPQVIPSYTIRTVGKDRQVILVLHNIGRTTAKGVKLHFRSSDVWHWVSNPEYAFLSGKPGIPVIAPNEKIEYFVGILRPGNPLSRLLTSHIPVKVEMRNPTGGRPLVDAYQLTLATIKFKSKLG